MDTNRFGTSLWSGEKGWENTNGIKREEQLRQMVCESGLGIISFPCK